MIIKRIENLKYITDMAIKYRFLLILLLCLYGALTPFVIGMSRGKEFAGEYGIDYMTDTFNNNNRKTVTLLFLNEALKKYEEDIHAGRLSIYSEGHIIKYKIYGESKGEVEDGFQDYSEGILGLLKETASEHFSQSRRVVLQVLDGFHEIKETYEAELEGYTVSGTIAAEEHKKQQQLYEALLLRIENNEAKLAVLDRNIKIIENTWDMEGITVRYTRLYFYRYFALIISYLLLTTALVFLLEDGKTTQNEGLSRDNKSR